jgi:hypothetical protein
MLSGETEPAELWPSLNMLSSVLACSKHQEAILEVASRRRLEPVEEWMETKGINCLEHRIDKFGSYLMEINLSVLLKQSLHI